ncbi:hypothetical protein M7I_0090 [Glarea lozoyensis 74030]|uniref:Uncharacterized protein n=1 Tax=Glarea lozoyensis (strain ATCC 74030 / MF5533) TaxID=1104152 RepID=H0ECF3_GLAL7|nr:hypothetical protein M7I_0090 [Glarea lozoyensis 74030]
MSEAGPSKLAIPPPSFPVVGTVEELSTTAATQNLVRDQFETLFFGQYESHNNPAPGLRDILTNVVNMNPETRLESQPNSPVEGQGNSGYGKIESRFPRLPSEARDRLVMETVHALTAIGGHENPPARHIVGFEGVASVKEKLKTVSEELEDFVELILDD